MPKKLTPFSRDPKSPVRYSEARRDTGSVVRQSEKRLMKAAKADPKSLVEERDGEAKRKKRVGKKKKRMMYGPN